MVAGGLRTAVRHQALTSAASATPLRVRPSAAIWRGPSVSPSARVEPNTPTTGGPGEKRGPDGQSVGDDHRLGGGQVHLRLGAEDDEQPMVQHGEHEQPAPLATRRAHRFTPEQGHEDGEQATAHATGGPHGEGRQLAQQEFRLWPARLPATGGEENKAQPLGAGAGKTGAVGAGSGMGPGSGGGLSRLTADTRAPAVSCGPLPGSG